MIDVVSLKSIMVIRSGLTFGLVVTWLAVISWVLIYIIAVMQRLNGSVS